MSKQYEVTWGMVYQAQGPKDALQQALGDLGGIINVPSEGPNIFVIREVGQGTAEMTLHADEAGSDYWCAICERPIEGDDIDARHSTVDGEDCHEGCCVICALEGMA